MKQAKHHPKKKLNPVVDNFTPFQSKEFKGTVVPYTSVNVTYLARHIVKREGIQIKPETTTQSEQNQNPEEIKRRFRL